MASDKQDQAMRLPIVGYCGHRKGEKSENMFAKNYRETTMMATKNLRATKAMPTAAKWIGNVFVPAQIQQKEIFVEYYHNLFYP